MTQGGLILRQAVETDAGAIARLHVRVWKQTYANLAPPEVIKTLNVAHRLPGWQKTLANPSPHSGTIAAEADGKLVGFVVFGPTSQPELGSGAEIKYLYIESAAQGAGLGRRLLEAAFTALIAFGYSDAALAVVEGNQQALAFYQAVGGRSGGSFTDAGPVWRSQNHIFNWSLEARG